MKKSNKICNIILIVLTSISFAFFLFYLSLNQIFNAMQCLMLFACMNLPLLIKLIFKYHISIAIITIYYLFLIAHFVFGEIIGFYILIKHYDTFLHFSSSFCICYFTFKIIRIYSYKTKVIFCFLIGISIEYIWYIFEFCIY